MGFWSGNQNIGDVLGLIIGDIVIQRLDVSCYWAIMFGATTLWLTTATILFTPLSPEDVDITDQVRVFDEAGEQEPINGNTSGSSDALVMPRKQVNFWNAWLLPGVALYVLGFVRNRPPTI
jgi:OPA family glycerol-3-phosphate transporter-like MFS transporter 3